MAVDGKDATCLVSKLDDVDCPVVLPLHHTALFWHVLVA